MADSHDASPVDDADHHGAVAVDNADDASHDAHGDDHEHGHGDADDHGPADDAWVLLPLLVGAVLGLIIAFVFALQSGAPALS